MSSNKKELNFIVITGPTATGKTKVAVDIAYQYNGEIISADSRQIYKGMDIGTGKDLAEYQINNTTINYHLIDILQPTDDYSVFQFKHDCQNAIKLIQSKNKIPIICGGTGLYIESILLDYQISNTKPNYDLRQKLAFTGALLLVYRLGGKVQIPGLDTNVLESFMEICLEIFY